MCLTTIPIIWEKHHRNTLKNTNHVQKDSEDLVSIITTLGTYISGGDKVFNNRVKQTDFGKRAHILRNYMVEWLWVNLKNASLKFIFEEDTDQ